ncbi:MAG: helix-turn-helix domain-containing protein [Nocardioides sp.]
MWPYGNNWEGGEVSNTVRELGVAVRSARQEQGMTQADLATRLGVGRDWIVRLEKGHPRLEAQRVLDALAVLGLVVELRPRTAADDAKSDPDGLYAALVERLQ